VIALHGRTVVPGYAEGEALVSPEPISGWGGIDPAAGRIIEPRHVLNGVAFTGKVLVFPSAKGSSGMLCLASCDKTAPGQLMAAARLNIPSVIVACGYQPSGTYRGRPCDIEDVFLAAGHVANGKLSVAELTEMSEHAVLGPGVCAGLGTANTMHLACEAASGCCR
jgi:predicted aconitase with swiveling domain